MKDIFTSSAASVRKRRILGAPIVIALVLAVIQSASAEFISETLARGVHLYEYITPAAIDLSGDTDGLFDPANQSLSAISAEYGTLSANIDHQSNILFGAEEISITLTDSGTGNSAPADGHRGTLHAYNELRVRFSSDVPFTFTLTSTSLTHSSGSPGNAVSVPYGVMLHSAITDNVFASYTLDNPTGSTTLTLPAGQYLLDSFSGMSFDAVFGDPPAAGYSSDFSSAWSFTATPLPDPSIAKRAKCRKLEAALKRAKAVFKKSNTKRNKAKVSAATKALNRCKAELAALL